MEKQFLIVGQGIAGSLLAYEMYKAGMNFTIISNPEIKKASDVAAGMYNPMVFKRLTKSWMVDQVLPVMTNSYQRLEEELGEQFLFPMDIVKPLLEDEGKMWEKRIFDGDFSEYMEDKNEGSLFSGLKNFSLYGKVTKSGHVDLAKLLSKLRDFFMDKDLLIEANFEYKDLGFINGNITWQGITARTIVFCEGYHGAKNPYFKNIAFKPTKGELLEIECKDLPENNIINKNLFVLPVGNHRFKVGATYDWKDQNEELTTEAKTDLLSRLDKIIDVPYTVHNHWAGVRPTISDRRPVLGVHPHHEGIAIFNGLGTKGVMLAPYFAKEMVQFLLFKNYPLDKEVDIRRFY